MVRNLNTYATVTVCSAEPKFKVALAPATAFSVQLFNEFNVQQLLRYSHSTISIKYPSYDGCALFSSIQDHRAMYSEAMRGTVFIICKRAAILSKLTPYICSQSSNTVESRKKCQYRSSIVQYLRCEIFFSLMGFLATLQARFI
jgi:hypothetical protein